MVWMRGNKRKKGERKIYFKSYRAAVEEYGEPKERDANGGHKKKGEMKMGRGRKMQ